MERPQEIGPLTDATRRWVWPLLLVIASSVLVHCNDGEIAAPGDGPALEPNAPGRAATATAAGWTDACTSACVSAADDEASWSLCYACKCRAALGELPSPAQLDCDAASEVAIYSLSLEDGVPVRSKNTADPADGCANPALVDMASDDECVVGSRLGQITMPGGSLFKFICRRKAGAPPGAFVYDDYGVIGHNPANGATCFWVKRETEPASLYDGKLPALDITDDDQVKVAAYVAGYERQEGDRCVACHDNDPFMYSSYLESVWDFRVSAHRFSKYEQIRVMSDPTPTPHLMLASPEAAACTTCHRITNGETCASWASAATGGFVPHKTYQETVMEDADAYYPLSYWMPPRTDAFPPDLGPPATHDAWAVRFGDATSFIRRCCDHPGDPACLWVPLGGRVGVKVE